MPFVHELTNEVTSNGRTLFAGGSALLILGGTAIKYMANAGENERLIKQHRSKSTRQKTTARHDAGEMYGTVDRGWRIGFPFIRSYCKVSLRQRIGRLDDYNIMSPVITDEASLTDSNVRRKKMLIQAKVNYAIADEPYAMNRATYDFESKESLDQTVTSMCNSGLRYVTENMVEEASADQEILLAGLQAVRGAKLLAIAGVEIRGLELINATVTDAQILSEGSSRGADPVKLQAVGQTDLSLSTETSLHAV